MRSLILTNSPDTIMRVIEALQKGSVVALPTETVYGLAADATDSRAVADIYALKERPQFNPLIVHVSSVAMAQRYVEFNERALQLAELFWPGPLTLILKARHNSPISPLVSAGLSTLAIRIPAHPLIKTIIEQSGLPLAAPSANPSGKLSATHAEHVAHSFNNKDLLILDGGPCMIGLESTIIDVSGNEPVILRYGGISPEEIAKSFMHLGFTHSTTIKAPGMMSAHYAPHTPLQLNASSFDIHDKARGYLAFGSDAPQADNVLNLSLTGDLVEAASRLFDHLFTLDRRKYKQIYVAPIPLEGLGFAINDRLRRAATRT